MSESEKPYGSMPQPGDLVSFEINGVLHTEYYTGPPVYPSLSAWGQTRRTLTPARWRKPLQPVRPPNPLERAQAMNAKTLAWIEELDKPVKVSWWRRLRAAAGWESRSGN